MTKTPLLAHTNFFYFFEIGKPEASSKIQHQKNVKGLGSAEADI